MDKNKTDISVGVLYRAFLFVAYFCLFGIMIFFEA